MKDRAVKIYSWFYYYGSLFRAIQYAQYLCAYEDISLRPYVDGKLLLHGRYRVKKSGEIVKQNQNSDFLLAEFEKECRKFRKLEWVEKGGFDLAEAWRKWKERQGKE